MEREQWVAQLDRELRSGGSPERTERERAYLKSRLEHYGTPVPAVRGVVKAFRRRMPLSPDQRAAVLAARG